MVSCKGLLSNFVKLPYMYLAHMSWKTNIVITNITTAIVTIVVVVSIAGAETGAGAGAAASAVTINVAVAVAVSLTVFTSTITRIHLYVSMGKENSSRWEL